MASKITRSSTRVRGFSDAEMDFQLMRSLGVVCYGGGALGEVLSLVGSIKEGDPVSWTREFSALGERVAAMGEEALAKNHTVSAHNHFLRSSMYYRAAEYYEDPFKLTHRKLGLKSRDTFIKAAEFFDPPVEVLKIPYEDTWMPGYFLRPSTDGARRKTVIIVSGFDGSDEELYFQCGTAALERGYNVMIFAGPGQTGMLRFHPDLKFRPDYEVPISAAVDYALSIKEVDPDRLALYGISFGGYFSARGAAFEPRLKAVIPNSPIVDLHAYMVAFLGPEALEDPNDITLEEANALTGEELPPADKWAIKIICWRYGVLSFKAWLKRLEEFRLGDAVSNITCPSLALVGEGEGSEAVTQTDTYCSGVSGPVTRHVFTVAQGADSHCQLNNLALSCAVVYDWLDELFG
ncbi:MAG: prolyl oligopeptidase family serine peptidase [Candidatus Brocadiales bacterium]|nr:prolyl oligopeptidase family serine peptidase [Candidatus Bathyanammoxibius amoris]